MNIEFLQGPERKAETGDDGLPITTAHAQIKLPDGRVKWCNMVILKSHTDKFIREEMKRQVGYWAKRNPA